MDGSPAEEVESSPQSLRDRRSVVGCEWTSGACASRYEFVAGRPAWFYVSGVGGGRLLGACPIPDPHALWRAMDAPMLNALSERAKPPSARGDMDVCCFRSSVTVRTDAQFPLDKMSARFARTVSVNPGIV